MGFTTILTHREASTLYVQINRPEVDNKLSIACMQELRTLFERSAQDKICRAIVLSGNSDWFCSGGELGDFRKKSILEIRTFGAAFISLHLAMQNCARPIIAAVEGKAFGGGCSLVEACDLAIAAEDAQFAVPEILDGLAPAMGFSGIFSNLPKKKAMAMGLLGEKLDAAQALAAGLVNQVVPRQCALQAAGEMAAKFAGLTPTGVRLFKEMYADMGQRDYENRLKIGQGMMISLFKSKDGMEVLNSRDENRHPIWCEE